MKKRYSDGDLIESESESLSIPEEGTGLKFESFSDAFKRNRAAGEKTFEYKGKKYTTEMAGEKKTAPKSEDKENPEMVRKAYVDAAKLRANQNKPKMEGKFSASGSIGASPAKKAPSFMTKALGMKSGGSVSSASKRADGCAIKGKTKGRMV